MHLLGELVFPMHSYDAFEKDRSAQQKLLKNHRPDCGSGLLSLENECIIYGSQGILILPYPGKETIPTIA